MNRKEILSISIIGVCLIGAMLIWVLPSNAYLQNTRLQIHEAIIKREQMRLQQNDIVTLKRQYEKIQKDAEALQTAFLQKDDASLIQLIDSIEKKCEDSGLDHSVNIAPLPQNSSDPITESEITITARGTLESVMSLLDYFEKQPSYYSFSDVQLSAESDEKRPIQIVLKGKIFWQ